MKTICLYFQIHQPFRLRRYRFFDIGIDHYYYDDYLNESIIRRVADRCYLPANKLLLELVKKYKDRFRLAFSISGMALDQLQLYAPEVITSFRKLAGTGAIEFIAETYSHSLVSLKDKEEFSRQVNQHREKIRELFGQTPTVFRNTELIYSDAIGEMVSELGFKAMLTEGAKHILGWKSPNFLYCNAINPRLKVLLRNFKLSDDISFRFSNKGWSGYPLTAEKYTGWLKAIPSKEEIINLFIDYETFGEHQRMESGIFNFLKSLPASILAQPKMRFGTPSEIADQYQPVSAIHVPYPISWADEERDLTAWLGNDLQEEAFNKLYELSDTVQKTSDPSIHKDWEYLQNSDHFYYMCTKFFSDGMVHAYFNPYNSPYDAFINYMNILSDFRIRLDAAVPKSEMEMEIVRLTSIIAEKDSLIRQYQDELRQSGNGKEKKTARSARKTGPSFSSTLKAIMTADDSEKKSPATQKKKPAVKKPAKTGSKKSRKK
jgi:alpha-amylase